MAARIIGPAIEATDPWRIVGMIASIVQTETWELTTRQTIRHLLCMRGKSWKGLVLAGGLAVMASVSSTSIPTKACVFLHEFKKSSKAGDRVSVWERVVYSLIEANHQTTELRAPSPVPIYASPESA